MNKKNIIFIVVIAILISLGITNILINRDLEGSTDFKFRVSSIFISSVDDWENYASNSTWCRKVAGTTNQYAIENVEIDGQGERNCITIINSNVFFTIQNSIIKNGLGEGIYLENVRNGRIINNEFRGNYGGIKALNCDRLSISDNNLLETLRNGMELINTNFSNLLSNIASNNMGVIHLKDSHHNAITDNEFFNNTIGIYFNISNSNNVLVNNIISNSYAGLFIQENDKSNQISRNTFINNHYGMIMDKCEGISAFGNSFSNGFCGIIINKSIGCNVSGNHFTLTGVKLQGSGAELSSHFIDSSNLVNGKLLYYYINIINLGDLDFFNASQIILINCNNSAISDVNLSRTTIAIALYNCKGNMIQNNNVSNNNLAGIYLWNSTQNELINNTASSNGQAGFGFEYSMNNTLRENLLESNYYGLGFFKNSSFNQVIYNTFRNNLISFFQDNSSIGNNLSGNSYLSIANFQENYHVKFIYYDNEITVPFLIKKREFPLVN